MFARILTAAFYAAIFFALGAWSGGHMQPVWRVLGQATVATGQGAVATWEWLRNRSGDAAALRAHAQDDPAAVLEAAREAFARGDLATAVADYRLLIAKHPGNADAMGELGNVFYTSGQTGEAAQAYHDAALALIAADRAAKARALLPVILAAAPGLAQDVEARLSATEKGG